MTSRLPARVVLLSTMSDETLQDLTSLTHDKLYDFKNRCVVPLAHVRLFELT